MTHRPNQRGTEVARCGAILTVLAMLPACTSWAEKQAARIEDKRQELAENAYRSLGDAHRDKLQKALRPLFDRLTKDDISIYGRNSGLPRTLANLAKGPAETVYAQFFMASESGKTAEAKAAAQSLREVVVDPLPTLDLVAGRTPLAELTAALGPPTIDFRHPLRDDQRCVVFSDPAGWFRITITQPNGQVEHAHIGEPGQARHLVCFGDEQDRFAEGVFELGPSGAARVYRERTPAGVSQACKIKWEEFAERLSVDSPVVDGFRVTATVDDGRERFSLRVEHHRDMTSSVPRSLGVQATLASFFIKEDAKHDRGPIMTITTDTGAELTLKKILDVGKGTDLCSIIYETRTDRVALSSWCIHPLRFQKFGSNEVFTMPTALIDGFMQRLDHEKTKRDL